MVGDPDEADIMDDTADGDSEMVGDEAGFADVRLAPAPPRILQSGAPATATEAVGVGRTPSPIHG